MLLSAGERAASAAKARVLRGRRRNPDDFDRLLECETVGAIATYLSRTEAYGGYFAEGARPETMRRWELEELIAVAPVVEEIPFCHYLGAVRASIVRAWGGRFDVEIVKRMLRIITTGVGDRDAVRRWVGSAPVTTVDGDKLIASRTLRDILEAIRGRPLERAIGEPLRRALSSGSQKVTEETLFHIKTAMDSFFVTHIYSEAGRLPVNERRHVRALFGVRADLINLYWIYRGRKFFGMSPEEALAMTLPVRHRLNFELLGSFAFAPDVKAMTALMRESRYGPAFEDEEQASTSSDAERTSLVEMALEHNLYRFLWAAAVRIFASGSSGVHVPLAYLTLRELEVKDLFTIIEGVRYHFDTRRLRGFLIHPDASVSGREGRTRWLS